MSANRSDSTIWVRCCTHETDALSERFAEKEIRFKAETISRGNPGYSHYGRGGLSTRMRIWVHEADLAEAKPIVDKRRFKKVKKPNGGAVKP